jgi:hypothetical protein
MSSSGADLAFATLSRELVKRISNPKAPLGYAIDSTAFHKKGAPWFTAPESSHRSVQCREDTQTLSRVVHFEFDRMRRVLKPDDFAHFQIDIGIDEIVIEYSARREEAAIFVELFEGLAQRAANSRNLL